MKNLLLMFICLCFFDVSTKAQHYTEMGSQAVINYTPKEYNANPQNWAITQDERGVMYFGNDDGLLEFDGNTWRLYQVPNKTIIRALDKSSNGKIYAGAASDLGYFLPDSAGKLTFHSLMKYLPENMRNFSDVWDTYVSGGMAYFNTGNYIFVWNIQNKKFIAIKSHSSFKGIFKVNNSIYVRETGIGLEVFKSDSLRLVKGGEKFANLRIKVMLSFPGEKGTSLIITDSMGLFKYDGSKFIHFKTSADKFIKENPIYCGTVLSDGNIFLGTSLEGAIVIDTTGKEIHIYNLKNGIIDDYINYAFQDRSGGIWLATQNGISRIDYSSPVSYFDSRNNFSGNSTDIIWHNGIIYAASNHGVYSLDPNTSIFHLLKGNNSNAWSFVEIGNELLVGTDNGLFKVEKDELKSIKNTVGDNYEINYLKHSKLNPNRIYVATYNGLWSVLKSGNNWKDEGKILNNNDQNTSIVENKDGSLWLGTFSTGLFRITFHKDEKGNIILNEPVIEHFNKRNGLQDGYIEVEKVNSTNYFITTDSIYKFNENKKFFYTDTSDKIISAVYKMNNKKAIIDFRQDQLGRVCISFKDRIEMGIPEEAGSYKWISDPFNRFEGDEPWEMYAESNGITWFGTGSSIIKYDFNKKNFDSSEYSTLVRSVEIGDDSTIFFGDNDNKSIVPSLNFKNNSIKFTYSAASYEEKNGNKFRTFLIGFDKGWSSWSTETTKEYTNLPPGKYMFKVASLNIIGIEGKIGTYAFIIFPPWYNTWWAYFIYIVLFGIVVFVIDRMQRKRLIKKERYRAEIERKENELKHAKEIEKAYKELKDTQVQLIHSEKMASLGELTAGIAHEIKNPLNFVNNFSEISNELLDELKSELLNDRKEDVLEIIDDLKQNLEKINHHGKRADSIVKGMLLHSRGTTGEKTLTDINSLLDEYVNLAYHGMRAQNKDFNITIEKDYDESIGNINVVPQDISRVFLNIINNGCYAANDKKKTSGENLSPKIKILTKNLKDKVEIRIADNGNGVPDKIKDKLFQPFFTTKPTGEGTGLGLSLSYDIVVKQHNGEIKIVSNEGEGAEFILTLPK